jgi:hypothetical protein
MADFSSLRPDSSQRHASSLKKRYEHKSLTRRNKLLHVPAHLFLEVGGIIWNFADSKTSNS